MTEPRDIDIEHRLRAALDDRANAIEVSPDGLSHIEEKLMTEISSTQKRVLGGLAAAAAVVVAFVIGMNVGDDDSSVTSDTSSTTETTETTQTTESPSTTGSTTTTTTPAAEVDPYGVAWPAPGTENFEAPVETAEAYATDVLGFTRLVVGDFLQGDSRSGEVVISDREGGRDTIVILRQMEDDHWYVLGSQTPDITVDTPTAGQSVPSPFETSGKALAFEGHVGVVVLTQAELDVAGEGFVTGSGTPPAGPFSGEISYTAPDGDTPGLLVYRTLSAEDGHVEMATSFPVRLTGDTGS